MSSRSTGLKDGSQMFGQKWHNKGQPQQGPKTASHKNAQNLIDPKKHGQQIADPFKNMAGKNNGKKKRCNTKKMFEKSNQRWAKSGRTKNFNKMVSKTIENQSMANEWPAKTIETKMVR